MIFESRKFNQL